MMTIESDLSKRLDEKLKFALEDYVDLCGRTDINEADMMMTIITLCSHYLALAAIQADATEHEYLAICRYQYRLGLDAKKVEQG